MYVPFCVFRFIVLFCVLFVCKCVLYCTVLYCTVLYCTVLYCTVLLPPGVNPIAVNKYIISYHRNKRNETAQQNGGTNVSTWASELEVNTLRTRSFKLLKRPFPGFLTNFNPLNAELNPICYLLALLAHHFLHVSRIRVKSLSLRLLMSYIWSAYSWCF